MSTDQLGFPIYFRTNKLIPGGNVKLQNVSLQWYQQEASPITFLKWFDHQFASTRGSVATCDRLIPLVSITIAQLCGSIMYRSLDVNFVVVKQKGSLFLCDGG